MKWKEVVKSVSERSGVSLAETRAVLTSLTEVTSEALQRDDKISLPNVGTLSCRWTDGRVLRGVGDQKRMWVGGRYSARFRAAAALKRELERGSQWRSPAHQRAWRLAETLIDDLDLYHANLAPSDLRGLAPNVVLDRCATAFGAHWEQVVQTWNDRIDEGVDTPFLAIVAARRWS